MPRGVRKSKTTKTIDERIEENKQAIADTENLLKTLKEENKMLIKEKQDQELKSLFDAIIDAGMTIADARELFNEANTSKTVI